MNINGNIKEWNMLYSEMIIFSEVFIKVGLR